MRRTIDPWLPAGFQGRVLKFVVVLVIFKVCLLVIGSVVVLILFATGVL